MPIFELNKLVRDGFVKEYESSNQKASYLKLSVEEHRKCLVAKIKEEADELLNCGDKTSIFGELR